MPCIFCATAAGDSPAHLLYEFKRSLAFLDVNPASLGHTLVIPRHHTPDLLTASEEDLTTLLPTAQKVARRLDAVLSPGGMNLVSATRAPAGQGVFHLHLHLIPRWTGDEIRDPWSASPAPSALLASLAGRLRLP